MYTCPECHKTFKWMSGFKQHMLTHTNEKTYTCDECDFKTRDYIEFVMHQRIHTWDGGYAAFVTQGRHIDKLIYIIHVGYGVDERDSELTGSSKRASKVPKGLLPETPAHCAGTRGPARCDECGACFVSTAALIRHINAAHGFQRDAGDRSGASSSKRKR
ncbi:Protein krueppel [Gryllus bimaculatus]|nr:Protein krueppel [Gryllus bimaculatus]